MTTLLVSLAAKPSGLDQFAFVETYPSQDSSLSATNLTADSVYLSRVRVKAPIVVSTMRLYIGAAAGTVALGIYTGTLSGGLTRAATTAATAAAGTNAIQSLALTASYGLLPGVDYWFAFGSTGGSTTLTVARVAALAPLVLTTDSQAVTALKASAWSSGLPASLATLSGTGNTVWIRAS